MELTARTLQEELGAMARDLAENPTSQDTISQVQEALEGYVALLTGTELDRSTPIGFWAGEN